ncbi:TPA: hypothetical protein I7765_20660 [Vibrio vulnificus]|nr:hypothetical protein [Vibrio vulnificus]
MLAMIEKLINEHGSSTILKERLQLINDKYEVLESKLNLAEKENESLKEEIQKLKSQLETQVKSKEFVSFKGAKFKRKPSGSFDDTVYCPKCDSAMFALENFFPFSCGSCGVTAGFNGGQLTKVLQEVAGEYA